MTRGKKIHTVVGALVVSATIAGTAACGGSNAKRDLEGVPSRDPDKATVYNNVDGHPNLAVLCIDGAAWVTNTRLHDAALPDPRLDRTCPGAISR